MSEGMYELTARVFHDYSNLGHCAVKHKKRLSDQKKRHVDRSFILQRQPLFDLQGVIRVERASHDPDHVVSGSVIRYAGAMSVSTGSCIAEESFSLSLLCSRYSFGVI